VNITNLQFMKSLNQFSRQKVLVTGASGFIGSNLCRQLCHEGAIVHAISRTLRTSNALHWWQGDLEDISSVQHLMRTIKPDLIYHLSSNVTGTRAIEGVLPTLHSNFVSAVNLLTAATEIGCRRIILAGSLEEPETNQANPVPSSPYAAAKWASSTYARMFYELYQTPVVIARLFMVYGPNQNIRFIIPYVITSLLQRQPPSLSSGQRLVDWIHVDDVVAGLLAIADAPDVAGSTIDLGTGRLVTIREVVNQISNLVDPKIELLFGALPDRQMEQVRLADVVTSSAKLDWEYKISLEQGLKQTVDWYRDRPISLD
jgi:UDP-glucose 4-epimerase